MEHTADLYVCIMTEQNGPRTALNPLSSVTGSQMQEVPVAPHVRGESWLAENSSIGHDRHVIWSELDCCCQVPAVDRLVVVVRPARELGGSAGPSGLIFWRPAALREGLQRPGRSKSLTRSARSNNSTDNCKENRALTRLTLWQVQSGRGESTLRRQVRRRVTLRHCRGDSLRAR